MLANGWSHYRRKYLDLWPKLSTLYVGQSSGFYWGVYKGGRTGGARGAIASPKIALWGSALCTMCYLWQCASPSAPPISYCFLRPWVCRVLFESPWVVKSLCLNFERVVACIRVRFMSHKASTIIILWLGNNKKVPNLPIDLFRGFPCTGIFWNNLLQR